MHVHDVVSTMVNSTGTSRRAVSVQCGHVPTWLTAVLQRESMQVDTLAQVATVCGYRLCCVPSDAVPCDALVIDS